MIRKRREFLRNSERQELLETVRDCEKKTSAEIVIIVEQQSNGYTHAVFMGSLVISTLISIMVNAYVSFSILWNSVSFEYLWVYPSVFAICFIAFYFLIDGITPIKRMVIPGIALKEEVFEAAVTAFHVHGLGKTSDRNGILFYISIFEHEVYILTDSGINEVIDKTEWENIVKDMITGIKNGNQKQALISGVHKAVTILVPHFPPSENDRNELPNLFIDNERMD